MKKKNLIILLLIPFLIALLGVVTINTTFSFIDNDIIGIDWNYNDTEAFKLTDSLYSLNASGINEKNYPAGAGNALIWTVRNQDASDENVYAEIVKSGNKYYLKTLALGRIVITCSNEKGNVFRSMNAIIYDTGVVLIQSKNASSQANIDQNQYYGEYDLKNGQKVPAEIEYTITAIPETMTNLLVVENYSDNVLFDINSKKLKILGSGKGYFTIGCQNPDIIPSTSYTFNIVDEGVNVYTYDDLLACTNKSNNGEVMVLQKSFESVDNTYQINANGEIMMSGSTPVLKNSNTVLFGNYDVKKETFNFKNEVYKFKTTYSTKFIDSWNEHMKKIGSSNTITDQVIAGLRVQKSVYGNGYTINLHNLTYPSGSPLPVTDSSTGQTIYVPQVDPAVDLFQGPLPYYTLGNHNNMPLVEALGQDNIGMYVDGDNIVINDVNLKNCDFGNMLVNLNTTGTVLETHGNNITIKNSRISNGKNVIRSFSSMNVSVDNCLISNARNFLISLGTNEYVSVDETKLYDLYDINGNKTSTTMTSYLEKEAIGDNMLNNYLMGSFESSDSMRTYVSTLQEAFVDSGKDLPYKGSMTVNDTLFYRSGIASISLETMFNGPFLFSSSPSQIGMILQFLTTSDGKPLGEFLATNVGGTSYPVELNINGKTRFYDYKTKEGLDINGLINENISSFASSVGYDGEITIDHIFPIKNFLYSKSPSKITRDEKTYLNIPIAFYGGGLNLSKVNVNSEDCINNFAAPLEIDFLDYFLTPSGNKPGSGLSGLTPSAVKGIMEKAVTVVTGYEPFEFICIKPNGYLYGEAPKVSDLISNLKGE